MSASQEKKRRQSAAAQPQPAAPQDKSGRGPWIAAGIGVGVLLLLAIFFAVLNSGLLQRNSAAATVGSHELSPVMYNYFYENVVYQNYYGMTTDVDTAAMIEQTNTVISQTYAVCDAAEAAGYALSEDDQASIETEITNLAYQAASQGVSVNAYLANVYGTGANEENYRNYLELRYLASSYQTAYADGLTYTADELETYYQDNRDSLDTVSYRSYTFTVYTGETDEDGSSIVDSAASQAQAEEMAAAVEGDETAFADYAREDYAEQNDLQEGDTNLYEDEGTTLRSDISLANLSEHSRDWLTDESRQYGDTTCYENDNGSWTVVMFVDNWTKYEDVNLVNVRHILLSVSDTSDEEAMSEAELQAEDILDEYLAGDQTEDAFAALAQQYSADGSASDGGLIEDITPGQMVEPFEDWCFDESRQPGDTGIVESEFGYHVMYFVSTGENWKDYRIANAMRTEDANAWVEELAAELPVTTQSFGMLFVG